MAPIDAISSRKTRGQLGGGATVLVAGFLGIFAAAGCAIGYVMSARPLYLAWQARGWTPAVCEVISSRIVHGDDTARADIVYRYEFDGRQYTADRYNFIPGLTSDASVPDAVARHQPGMHVQCYVDPADPARAVINRTATLWYFIGLPFFVMFAGVPGAIGLALLSSRRSTRRAEASLMAGQAGGADPRFAPPPGTGETAPIVLKPTASPLGKVIGMTVVCLFWNGIVGVFTFFEYQMFAEGDASAWFMGLFLLLFQAVGVALLWGVVYQVLALVNPRPVLTLSRATIPLGGLVSFGWELTGAAHRVTRLEMVLEGREEARYRRGTDTKTDTHVFFSHKVVDATHAMAIRRGSGTIRVPAGSMHSFTADNNKIVWTLKVNGEIARWPNVDDSFELEVRPA